jgi:hypothetical protein
MPNLTPIFLGFLAPPPKTGHFDIFWFWVKSAFWGSKKGVFLGGGQKPTFCQNRPIFGFFESKNLIFWGPGFRGGGVPFDSH